MTNIKTSNNPIEKPENSKTLSPVGETTATGESEVAISSIFASNKNNLPNALKKPQTNELAQLSSPKDFEGFVKDMKVKFPDIMAGTDSKTEEYSSLFSTSDLEEDDLA